METEAELESEYTTIDDNRSLRSVMSEENDLGLHRRRSRVDKLPTLEEDIENQGLNPINSNSQEMNRREKGEEDGQDLLELKNLMPDRLQEKFIGDEDEKRNL